MANMASENIMNVTEADFEYEVIAYSRQVPVVVDFWAEWCAPCKQLSPILENLAQEGNGAFRLAKVDVDANPNLALRYSVRSIPNVKAFQDGQVVAEFLGMQPESRIREFIRKLAPSEHDLLLEKAQGLLLLGEAKEAEAVFRQFLVKAPENPAAMLGLARSLLLQRKIKETRLILGGFPASKEYNSAQLLTPLVVALVRLQDAPPFSDDPLEAAYLNALRLVSLGNFEAAMDGMLDVLRQDKHYHNDEVRKVLLGMFEMLGDENPLTRQYRNELASVLF
jgi:putative thioredoxin